MAKSTRSKVKRAHRAKKREDGVYAAIEAARLARLATKLKAVALLPADSTEENTEGDEIMEDGDFEDAEGAEGEKVEGKGWCHDSDSFDSSPDVGLYEWLRSFGFAAFALLEAEDITPKRMERLLTNGSMTRKIMEAMTVVGGSSYLLPSPSSHLQSGVRARQSHRATNFAATKSCH